MSFCPTFQMLSGNFSVIQWILNKSERLWNRKNTVLQSFFLNTLNAKIQNFLTGFLYCAIKSRNKTSLPFYINYGVPLSATKAPKKDGKGYEAIRNISVSSGMKWLKQISACKPLADLAF